MNTIILIVFLAAVCIFAGLAIWLYKNSKKSKEEAQVTDPDVTEDQKNEEQESQDISVPEEPEDPETTQEELEQDPTEYVFERFSDYTETILENFMNIDRGTSLFIYIRDNIAEAWTQFYKGESLFGIPKLYSEENFPNVIDYYGYTKDEDNAFRAMASWIIAMILSDFFPDKRDEMFTIGFNLGGDKDDPIYAYEFHSDRNIARLVGAAVWAAMRGKHDVDKMKAETVGTSYNTLTVHKIAEDSFKTNRDTFFIDLTKFLPPTPGPYLNGYDDRSKAGGYPYEGWNGMTSDHNIQKDLDIYSAVVNDYNLNTSKNFDKTVQAIADKEACEAHLFGERRKVSIYEFDPVYGESNIGKTISPEGKIASMSADVWEIASMARRFMTEDQRYGRRRPGQSGQDGISKDGVEGVLCDFDIENNDGCPGVYNKQGVWVTGEEKKPGEFCEYQKRQVYANSYPSGHSAGMENVGLMLIELMPERADKILRATNSYAVNRTIARYHWNSDTIIGRVLGSATAPITRATRDFRERLEEAKREV